MNYIHKLKFTEEFVTSTHTEEDGTIVETSFTRDSKQVAEEVLRSIADKSVIKTIVHIGLIVKDGELVDGWHVDVLASSEIPELIPHCLSEFPSNPAHGNGWGENEYQIVLNRAA